MKLSRITRKGFKGAFLLSIGGFFHHTYHPTFLCTLIRKYAYHKVAISRKIISCISISWYLHLRKIPCHIGKNSDGYINSNICIDLSVKANVITDIKDERSRKDINTKECGKYEMYITKC